MEYKEAVDFLKSSLVFQMSLGSKELFHSNIWWWLIENDKNFIKVFIPGFDSKCYHDGEYIWPKREEKNRDILIWLENDKGEKSHLVIENKIKTLPTIEQLKGYTVNLGSNAFVGGVLTGIGECTLDLTELNGINNVNGTWSYVSYDDISKRIYDIAIKSEVLLIKSHISQIEEYCTIINCIGLVLKENLKKYDNILKYDHDGKLNDLRINDVFKKHKGSQFLNYIKSRRYEIDSLTPNGYWTIISQSFHNGKTTLDVRFSCWTSDEKPYKLLGVQIEGDQFRIVAEKNARSEKINSDDIYKEYSNIWFDDSYDKYNSRKIHGIVTTMKPRNNKKYDSYNTNGYCFVYQYFDISKIDNSYPALFELILEYIRKASNILK